MNTQTPGFTLTRSYPGAALTYIDRGHTGILDVSFDAATGTGTLRDHIFQLAEAPATTPADALAWATEAITASGYKIAGCHRSTGGFVISIVPAE